MPAIVSASPADIFGLYQDARPCLPVPARQGAAATAGDLAEIARDFDLILLDAFGVLNIGETAIPGAAERVEGLKRAGKRVKIVTNAASYPKRHLIERYRKLGFAFGADDVVSSRETMLANAPADRRWGLVADPRWGLEELEHLDAHFLADDRRDYDRAEGIVLLSSATWTEARQSLLAASLAARPRPVLVANPDIVAPRDGGFSFEPGHFAYRLARIDGVAPRFFGKPFAEVFEAAAGGGTGGRDRVLMVGDTLHTDILGGLAAGMRTALVTDTGSLHRGDVAGDIRRAGISPDHVLPRI